MSRVPRPKYQVFVSSTFEDLRAEREAVAWKILTMRHIPAGMETFPAADDRGWQTITRVIDDTDYYVIILAGRYGAMDPETHLGWTEREYNYASEKGIPVLAFIRSDDAIVVSKQDKDDESRRRLDAFKKRLRSAHLCKEWVAAEDLAGKVGDALSLRISDDEHGEEPRPGWYRGTDVPSALVAEELARLSAERDRLRDAIDEAQKGRPELHAGPLLVHPCRGSSSYFLVFGVTNLGTRVAEDVTVDIRVANVENVFLKEFTPEEVSAQYVGQPVEIVPAWAVDPNRIVHIDTHTCHKGAAWFRQRIKRIPPGLTEAVVQMGVQTHVRPADIAADVVIVDRAGNKWTAVLSVEKE